MMRRVELIEIHDHPLFPSFLRDLVTDALQALWKFGDSYHCIVPRLHRCLVVSRSSEVLDLCSGGGGPWLNLAEHLEQDHGFPVRIHLSDKFPNLAAFREVRRNQQRVDGVEYPVDAQQVPSSLSGFRTMFSSFHHFGPADAREVLRDAVAREQGIGIFEAPQRSLKTMLLLCLTPILVLFLTPQITPVRWSRLFWTYILPVVPAVILIDGLLSCLRAYDIDELRAMTDEVAQTSASADYHWEVGEERGGLLPVTYLIGCPLMPASHGVAGYSVASARNLAEPQYADRVQAHP